MKIIVLIMFLAILHTTSAAPRPLIIVAENYAPSSFYDDGQISGFDVDIARTVFEHLGVNCTFILVPWARAFYMLKNGQADVGLHVSYSEERASYVHWPKTPVWEANFVFMATKATKARYAISSYDDVKRTGLTVGIIQNNAYYPSFWEAFPSLNREKQIYNSQLDPASDAATNLKKLAAGRIQLFPFPLVLGQYMTRTMHLDNITHYDWVIFSKSYPNAFSNASSFSSPTYPDIAALMQAYDLELARMKSNPARFSRFFQHYKVDN